MTSCDSNDGRAIARQAKRGLPRRAISRQKRGTLCQVSEVSSCARAIVTFHIGLHEMCVRTGVRYVITKFSGEDSLPNFLTHGAPLRARFARARSSAITGELVAFYHEVYTI